MLLAGEPITPNTDVDSDLALDNKLPGDDSALDSAVCLLGVTVC